MSSYIPNCFEFALLAVAAWRTFQLLAEDDILDRPRRWVLRLGDWQPPAPGQREQPPPDDYRTYWGAFLTCPYCAGFWISLIWYLAWLAFGDWTVIVGLPLAINAGVVLGAKTLGSN